MKYISIGVFNPNLIFLPWSSIMNSLKYAIIELLDQKRKNNEETTTFNLLFYVFFMSISKIISGFGYILIFIRTKIKKKYKQEEMFRRSIQNRIKTKKNKKIVLVKSYYQRGKLLIAFLIILICIIELIVTLGLVFLAQQYGYIKGNTKLISILDFKLMSIQLFYLCGVKHLLKQNGNYYHQYLSYCLIFVGILLVFIPGIDKEIYLEFKIPVYCGLYILVVLQSLMEKWIMDMKYIKVHLLLLVEGLFSTGLCLIIGFVFDAIDDTTIFGSSIRIFKSTGICFEYGMMCLYFFISLISSSLYYLFMMITRYNYSLTHCAVADILSVFFSWIMLISTNMITNDMYYLTLIGFVLIIIGAIIYTEIIILHCFRFDEYTVPGIRNRSMNEFNESLSLLNEFDESYIELNEITNPEEIE